MTVMHFQNVCVPLNNEPFKDDGIINYGEQNFLTISQLHMSEILLRLNLATVDTTIPSENKRCVIILERIV